MLRLTRHRERPLDGGALDLYRQVLARGGHIRLRATGLSMQPAILPGDELVLGPVGARGAQRGEVVAWVHQGVLRIHRVTAVSERSVVTRGDAAAEADGEVLRSEVLGQVLRVERSLRRRLRQAAEAFSSKGWMRSRGSTA